MGQRMLNAQFIPERCNESSYLMQLDSKIAAILAQQAGFDEFRPCEAALACPLDSDHRWIDAPPALPSVEPPGKGAGAHSQNLRSVSKGVDPTVQRLHIHASIMTDRRFSCEHPGMEAERSGCVPAVFVPFLDQ